MTKKIKLGLSAMVAFAMMFATSSSVVAQEQPNAPKEKVEVKESVEAKVLSKQLLGLKDTGSDKSLQDYIYFDVEGNAIDIDAPLAGQPCSGSGPNCAIGFLESDVTYPNGPSNPPRAPTNSVPDAQSNYDVDLRQGLK